MNHYQQAMTKRIKADEYHNYAVEHDNQQEVKEANTYFNLAIKCWEEHAQLLKVVYPAPQPSHLIKVTIFDSFWVTPEGMPRHILDTSFSRLDEYLLAEEALGYDYDLETKEVGQCEMCDKHYLEKDGYTVNKQGFCSLECLKEDKLLRQIEVEDWENQYAERAADSDPYDQDTVFF